MAQFSSSALQDFGVGIWNRNQYNLRLYYYFYNRNITEDIMRKIVKECNYFYLNEIIKIEKNQRCSIDFLFLVELYIEKSHLDFKLIYKTLKFLFDLL